MSCRPIVKPHFHASIRKMRLYGTQNGDFSPLFGPSSDFGLSATIPQSLEIGLDTGETGDGRGGFRTCDLSRVKSHVASTNSGRFPCKFAVSQ
jgi:hypothetical protein